MRSVVYPDISFGRSLKNFLRVSLTLSSLTLTLGLLLAGPCIQISTVSAQQAVSLPLPASDETGHDETGDDESARVFSEGYQNYLARDFPATFEKLSINAETITAEISIVDQRDLTLPLAIAVLPAHVPSHHGVDSNHILDVELKRVAGLYTATIPRKSSAGNERSHCRFVLVGRKGNELTSLTPATYPQHWADGVQRDLTPLVGKDRKGLGGIPADAANSSHLIYQLGLSHATVNIVLDRLIRVDAASGFVPWQFEDRLYHINEKILTRYDRLLEQLRSNDIVVSMILLVGNQRQKGGKRHLLVHPAATPSGRFAMPNLTSEKSVHMYRAVLNQLANRWTQPGDRSGRVTNWIMHNEIDQSGTWTNMGDQSIQQYIETFTRSARLVHQVTGRFDPHTRVFISLTHFWTKISEGQFVFRVRDIVDIFARASVVEGDFPWGVAYHPYPQSLRQPRTWNDASVRFDFDTPLITPRNIEVLPAYLDQPQIRYLSKHPRPILLSEQGCNSPTLSADDQKIQAAGIVYMFLRMRQLPTIEAFHYHAFKDSPQVEQLRLGLMDENLKPKFAWKIYQALGTSAENDAIKFVNDIINDDARSQMRSLQKTIGNAGSDR